MNFYGFLKVGGGELRAGRAVKTIQVWRLALNFRAARGENLTR
jgi:hypothetical protein